MFFLVMCNNQRKELLPELSRAESLMQQHPDSALMILDSMEVSSLSDEFQYATWCLFITQARDKNYIKHTSDSLINIALDYFEMQNDPVRKATLLYYEGRVNHDLNNPEEATDYYLRARDVAKNTEDYKLLYLINSQLGTLYACRDLTNLASEAYKYAHNYSVQLKDSALISNSYSCLGRVAALDNDWPIALDYYKKAIKVAEQSGRLKALTLAYGEITTVYRALSILDSCIYYLEKAKEIEYVYNPPSLPQTFLGIGEAYYLLGQTDSACFYLEKALITTNIYTRQNIFHTLYSLYRDQEKCKEAIVYNEQYWLCRDSIDSINNSMAVAEIEAKYNQEKLLNINNQLEIEKGTLLNIILGILVILSLLISVGVNYYHQKLKGKINEVEKIKKNLDLNIAFVQKNKDIINQNEAKIKSLSLQLDEKNDLQTDLDEKKMKIEELRQQNDLLQTQNKQLEEEIEKYKISLQEKGKKLEAYGEVILENTVLHDREKYLCTQLMKHIDILDSFKSDPKYIKEYQWPKIYDSIDLIYPKLIDRLRKELSLTDGDIQICCLIKLGLTNPLIAELLGISPSSVTKRKQRLKERINMHLDTSLGGEISIEAYLGKF